MQACFKQQVRQVGDAFGKRQGRVIIVLMPPSTPEPTQAPQQPQNPNVLPSDEVINQLTPKNDPTKFDFMLKEPPKPKRSFGLPANTGKPVKLLIAAVIILVLVFVFASFFRPKDNTSKLVLDLMAQTQEINRVSQVEDKLFDDVNTQNLAATTEAALQSQQVQLGTYLAKIKVKYKPKEIATHLNKNTDAQLLVADQNNILDSTYALYLKNALATYQSSIQALYKTTKSKTLKGILYSAYTSNLTLLKSPQFNS